MQGAVPQDDWSAEDGSWHYGRERGTKKKLFSTLGFVYSLFQWMVDAQG